MTTVPVTETLKLTLEDCILDVYLNRPEKANAMNSIMWRELQTSFEWADACSDVRAIILSGKGENFCSGIDLSMLAEFQLKYGNSCDANEQFFHQIRDLQKKLQALQVCRKPVLVAMHGAVIGGALDMVCHADMRYASTDAEFCVKEIDIGIVADVGTLQYLPKLIPEGLARELAYTGRKMDADEAYRVGFLNRVFEDDKTLMTGVREIAMAITEKVPLAVRGTKQVLNYSRDHSVDDSLQYVALWNTAMMSKQN